MSSPSMLHGNAAQLAGVQTCGCRATVLGKCGHLGQIAMACNLAENASGSWGGGMASTRRRVGARRAVTKPPDGSGGIILKVLTPCKHPLSPPQPERGGVQRRQRRDLAGGRSVSP